MQLFVLFVLVVLPVATARAATLEDAAKTEGEVVLYSSLNNEQIVTLVDAFKKKTSPRQAAVFSLQQIGARFVISLQLEFVTFGKQPTNMIVSKINIT